jgi:hypothetical protein
MKNKVSLTKVEVLLANIADELSEAEQKKLATPFVNLQILAETMNSVPYSLFNSKNWKELTEKFVELVGELKEAVEDVAKDNKKVDCCPLKDALDLLLTQ